MMAGAGKRSWKSWVGLAALYTGTLAIIVGGAAVGTGVMASSADYPHPHQTIVEGMTAWDGEWFARVASAGYTYEDGRTPSLGFFPAYPILGRVIMGLTGMSANVALLIASNALMLGTLIVFKGYLSSRVERRDVGVFALACVALFPTTFFFRMAYSDGMLLFLMVLSMYGMRERWPVVVIALVIGLATATRAVGIALVAPFVLYLLQIGAMRNRADDAFGGGREEQARRRRIAIGDGALDGNELVIPPDRIVSRILLVAVACWGLAAYMGYQYYTYGDPLAFTKAEAAWHDRLPPGDAVEYAADLLTMEPVRAVYARDCPCYWDLRGPHHTAGLNLQFANPIYFCGMAILVGVGGYKGWLSRPEWVLSAVLLGIPYVSNAYRMCMTSHARFAAVVFPAYIVMGQLLARLPRIFAIGVLACFAILLGTYTAMFSSWYYFL